jgi:hypothetical protein
LIRTRIRYYARRFLSSRYGLAKLENLYWDVRFGGLSGRTMRPRFLEVGAYGTRNTSYAPLTVLFGQVQVLDDDVLVDVGCGKGRVLNFWLREGLRNRMFGLEIDPEVAAWVAHRLRRFPNVTIVTGDAVANLPPDASLLYMYNPFDEATMRRFKGRLEALDGRGRRLVLVYYAPRHVDVFRAGGRWEVERLATGRYEPAYRIRLKGR